MTFFPPQTIGAFLSAAYISIIHVVLSEDCTMNILVDVYSGYMDEFHVHLVGILWWYGNGIVRFGLVI